MTEYPTINKWNNMVHNYHSWRFNTSYAHKVMLAFMFAGLTGLGAFIKVYTPISPVPFTLQTFFVLMSGVMLGRYWGGLSQGLYVLIGLVYRRFNRSPYKPHDR